MYWLLEKKGKEFEVKAIRQTLEELSEEVVANPKKYFATEELLLEEKVEVQSTPSKDKAEVSLHYDLPELTDDNYFIATETFKFGRDSTENFRRFVKEYSTAEEVLKKLVEESRMKPKSGYGREIHLLKPIKFNVTYKVKLK